jgi:hypothetical protein
MKGDRVVGNRSNRVQLAEWSFPEPHSHQSVFARGRELAIILRRLAAQLSTVATSVQRIRVSPMSGEWLRMYEVDYDKHGDDLRTTP